MTGTETYSFGEWLKQRRERLRLLYANSVDEAHTMLAERCSQPAPKPAFVDYRVT